LKFFYFIYLYYFCENFKEMEKEILLEISERISSLYNRAFFIKIMSDKVLISTITDNRGLPYTRIDNKKRATSLLLKFQYINGKMTPTIIAVANDRELGLKNWLNNIILTIEKTMNEYNSDWLLGIENNENKEVWNHIYNKYKQIKFYEYVK